MPERTPMTISGIKTPFFVPEIYSANADGKEPSGGQSWEK